MDEKRLAKIEAEARAGIPTADRGADWQPELVLDLVAEIRRLNQASIRSQVLKAWEEDWTVSPDDGCTVYGPPLDDPRSPRAFCAEGLSSERARLAAQAPAMARLLLEKIGADLQSPLFEMRADTSFEKRARALLRAAGVLE